RHRPQGRRAPPNQHARHLRRRRPRHAPPALGHPGIIAGRDGGYLRPAIDGGLRAQIPFSGCRWGRRSSWQSMTYARDWARWASASGRYPVEAMRMMSRIVSHTEDDPHYRTSVDASRSNPSANAADAIGFAIRHVTELLQAAATVAYSSSGYSALRMARERPRAPIIGMTPRLAVARRLALVWGVHAVLCHDVADVAEIT